MQLFESPPPLDIDWGGVHTPEPMPINPDAFLNRPASLRNYGDIIHGSPEIAPLRYGEGGLIDTLEAGDTAPVARTFLRRLIGAVAEPLTAVSDELDRLALNFDPERAPEVWVRWLLSIGGLRVPADVPVRAARDLMHHVDELYPLGRAEGMLRMAEIVMGRAIRTQSTQGSDWLHTRLEFPGGATLTLSECWHPSSLDRTIGNRAVRITTAGVPDWVCRLLSLNGGGYFSARIMRDEDALSGELLLGRELA